MSIAKVKDICDSCSKVHDPLFPCDNIRKYIVTVKVYNKTHDPKNKRIGACITSIVCTDFTGHHHSLLVKAQNIVKAQNYIIEVYGDIHITRIEEVR